MQGYPYFVRVKICIFYDFSPSRYSGIPSKAPPNSPGNLFVLTPNYMKTLPLILGYTLTVRLPEIIIFLLGALVLGFTMHYFWSSKNSIRIQKPVEEGISENDNWKLKYYNDMDMQEKTLQQLRDRLAESEENEKILGMETEELQEQLKVLKEKYLKTEALVKPPTASDDYLHQLKLAQENLVQHNQHINGFCSKSKC